MALAAPIESPYSKPHQIAWRWDMGCLKSGSFPPFSLFLWHFFSLLYLYKFPKSSETQIKAWVLQSHWLTLSKSLAPLELSVSFLAGTYQDSLSLFFSNDSIVGTSLCHREWIACHLQNWSHNSLPWHLNPSAIWPHFSSIKSYSRFGFLTIPRPHTRPFPMAVLSLRQFPCLQYSSTNSLAPYSPSASPNGIMKGSFLCLQSHCPCSGIFEWVSPRGQG